MCYPKRCRKGLRDEEGEGSNARDFFRTIAMERMARPEQQAKVRESFFGRPLLLNGAESGSLSFFMRRKALDGLHAEFGNKSGRTGRKGNRGEGIRQKHFIAGTFCCPVGAFVGGAFMKTPEGYVAYGISESRFKKCARESRRKVSL